MQEALHKSPGYLVDFNQISTPKASHRLSDIQSVSVRPQVALSALLPVTGMAIGALMFGRYLYFTEVISIVGFCMAVAIISMSIGTLTVNSLALSHNPGLGTTWGYLPQLRKVKAAAVEAMALRQTVSTEQKV